MRQLRRAFASCSASKSEPVSVRKSLTLGGRYVLVLFMLDDTPRKLEILGQFAELELAAAKEAFQRAKASEEAQEFEIYSKAIHRHARSGRLSLALYDKLVRDDRREARETPPEPQPKRPEDYIRIARRRDEVGEIVRRVIWNEYENEPIEREMTFDLLIDVMAKQIRVDRDWGSQPLEDHVLELCAILGMSMDAADQWRDLPDPPDDFGVRADGDFGIGPTPELQNSA
jgi:hypothetical protein